MSGRTGATVWQLWGQGELTLTVAAVVLKDPFAMSVTGPETGHCAPPSVRYCACSVHTARACSGADCWQPQLGTQTSAGPAWTVSREGPGKSPAREAPLPLDPDGTSFLVC